jgi:hypothetical protein
LFNNNTTNLGPIQDLVYPNITGRLSRSNRLTGPEVSEIDAGVLEPWVSLSTAHILPLDPQLTLDRELKLTLARQARGILRKPYGARFECFVDASLIKVSRTRPVTQVGGGLRGKIEGFSRNSARRLMQTVNKIKRDELPYFVTLTYADTYPYFENPLEWKNDLARFGKRFGRAYPEAGFLWRLEAVDRKSGDAIGEVRPHYHLLVYGIPKSEYLDFREWIGNTWFDLVNTGVETHIRTQVRPVRTVNGVNAYASKGMSQVLAGEVAKFSQAIGETLGRWWGVWFRANIPWGEYFQKLIPDAVAKVIVRILRKSVLKKPGRVFNALNAFVNANVWKDALPKFIDGFS